MALETDLSKLSGRIVQSLNNYSAISETAYMEDNANALNFRITNFGILIPRAEISDIPLCGDCGDCRDSAGGVGLEEFKPEFCLQGKLCLKEELDELLTEHGISVVSMLVNQLKIKIAKEKDIIRISKLAGFASKKTVGKTYTDGAVAIKDFFTDLAKCMDAANGQKLAMHLSHDMYFLLQQYIKKMCCEGDAPVESLYDVNIKRIATDKLKTLAIKNENGSISYATGSKAINWIIFPEKKALGFNIVDKVKVVQQDCNFDSNLVFKMRHDMYVIEEDRPAISLNTK